MRALIAAGQGDLLHTLECITALDLSDDEEGLGLDDGESKRESGRSSNISTLSTSSMQLAEEVRLRPHSAAVSAPKKGARDTAKAKFRQDAQGHKYVNQYVLVKPLGTGTFGRVMLCVSLFDKKQYAIKVIDKQKHMRRVALRRKPRSGERDPLRVVRREVAILKKLNHPQLTYLHEVIEDPDRDVMFMVMEYVDGGPVLGKRQHTRPISEACAVGWIRDVCRGLLYLHERGIAHRDIKPANMLRTKEGVKLIDFGVAEIFDREDGADTCGSSGTPAFLAPEVIDSPRFLGPPLDVWALGVCLYYFVYCRLPFTGFNTMELYRAIVHKEVNLDDHEHEISSELKSLLRSMLDKDPANRASLSDVMAHPWMLKTGDEFVPDIEWQKGMALRGCQMSVSVRLSVTEHDVEGAVRTDQSGSMARMIDTTEAPRVSFKKGDVIFHQGDEANEAYFVERGECAIVLERPAPIAEDDNACKACGCDTSMCVHTVVAVRGPGEMVGEMALVYRNVNLAEEPARRTASMVARTDLVLYRLSQEQFARDMSANDECRTRLIDLVTERTRETADFKRRNSGEKNSLDNADNDVDSNELIVALQEYKDSSSSSASSSYERSRNNSLESRNSAGAVGSDAAGDEAPQYGGDDDDDEWPTSRKIDELVSAKQQRMRMQLVGC
jgi:[calcium/calmodulin-dependent protein kinase] kinase